MANRQFDPQFAQGVNDLAQQGLTPEQLASAGYSPQQDPHDPHAAAIYLLTQHGMSPVEANTLWSSGQGAYQSNKKGGLEEHKSAIDNPLIKAAVLAPMIAGGGFAAGGAFGGGGAASSAAGGAGGTGGGMGLGSVVSGLGGWGGIADLGLKAAGAVAKGRAGGRLAEQGANEDYDKLRLAAAAFNEKLPGERAHNAVRGDTLANVQDYALTGSGRNLSGSGGLRPSLMSADTRSLGKQMSRQAYLSQMGQGGAQDPYANFTPQAQPQAGVADKVLQGLGYGGAGLDILDQLRKRNANPYPGSEMG